MDPFLGQIKMFGGNFAPRGWALCQGQLLPINSNQALFSILGTTYGGDGRTTFGLPELRGRVALSEGQGPGLSNRPLGQKSGSETNTLNVQNLANHNHILQGEVKIGVNEEDPDTEEANGNVLANTPKGNIIYNGSAVGANAKLGGVSNNFAAANAGAGQPLNNMAPYLAVNFIIALQGTFPSRS